MFKTFRQQETVGCNAQGGVMMRATPAASLVVAQAEFLFKLLIVPLNPDSAVENVTVKSFGVKLEGGAQSE